MCCWWRKAGGMGRREDQAQNYSRAYFRGRHHRHHRVNLRFGCHRPRWRSQIVNRQYLSNEQWWWWLGWPRLHWLWCFTICCPASVRFLCVRSGQGSNILLGDDLIRYLKCLAAFIHCYVNYAIWYKWTLVEGITAACAWTSKWMNEWVNTWKRR